MERPNRLLERILRSSALSIVLAITCAAMAVPRAKRLFGHFDWVEALWIAYSLILVIGFLIRVRPSAVSTHPVHLLVALITSFSGFLYFPAGTPVPDGAAMIARTPIVIGLVLSMAAAIALRRSYDIFPALRGVSTGAVYRYIRHPMYTGSLLIRLGYVVYNPLPYNFIALAVTAWLYGCRARFEESVMRADARYGDYAARVRYRFIPGVY